MDEGVGARMRARRRALGMSQGALADLAGVKFQQIQKYESGVNRVAAVRLWRIARALDVPLEFFFEEAAAALPEAPAAPELMLLGSLYSALDKPRRREAMEMLQRMVRGA